MAEHEVAGFWPAWLDLISTRIFSGEEDDFKAPGLRKPACFVPLLCTPSVNEFPLGGRSLIPGVIQAQNISLIVWPRAPHGLLCLPDRVRELAINR
jgi:hypothetical protein